MCHLYRHATCHHVRTCHVSCTDCTDRYSQHPKKIIVCLGGQNAISSSVQTLFDKVNIPSELGRRDGHNGVGFVGFRALSFLSICPDRLLNPISDHHFSRKIISCTIKGIILCMTVMKNILEQAMKEIRR
jgi:hypothetical protein